VACGVWRVACGVWRVAYGVWRGGVWRGGVWRGGVVARGAWRVVQWMMCAARSLRRVVCDACAVLRAEVRAVMVVCGAWCSGFLSRVSIPLVKDIQTPMGLFGAKL
jgi:hypothetical protein